MSASGVQIPTQPMTSDEFLEWAAREEPGRVELIDGFVVPKDDGGPVGMAGDSPRHNLVKGNAYRALRAAVQGRGCRVFIDGIAVPAGGHSTYIPDVVVDCATDFDPDSIIATDAVIVVEVLSDSSYSKDTVEKLEGYFRLPAIQHSFIVDAKKRRVILHSRDGDRIATSILHGGTVTLDPPGCTLDLDTFWEDLPT